MMADLISRAATLERMKSMAGCATCDNYNYVRCRACSWDDAMNIVEEMSKVDAVPVVHGNWIECYERSHHYYCSNCGKVQGIASIVMKYCPECGAKMAEHPWAGRYADQSGAEYADNPTV